MRKLETLVGLLLLLFITSCENDPYGSGDGHYSKMTTEFGEAKYDVNGCAYKFVTDADEILNFTAPVGTPDSNKVDKSIRSLLYYNLTEEKNLVEPLTINTVLTANVIEKGKLSDLGDDPLKIESVWLSKNKKYLNLSLQIKTSLPEDKKMKHKLGLVFTDFNSETADLFLIHDDGGIPANYSVKCYFSTPVSSIKSQVPECKTVRITANTFKGMQTFELKL